MNFTWQNGNVIKMVEDNKAAGGKIETDFEYYTDKEVKSLPFSFTNAFELLLFQPCINFGNSIKNPIKVQTIHAFDANGQPTSKTFHFGNYILDDNDYVVRFSVSDDYGTKSDFSFNYKCF